MNNLPEGYKQTDVGIIPSDWAVVFINKISEIIDGDRGNNYPNGNDFDSNGYCLFLNAKNVTSDGFRFDDCQFISKEKDEKLNKGKLVRNDVVLTTRGTVGNFAFYDNLIPFKNIRINSGMVIIRINPIVDSIFCYRLFQSNFIGKQVERLSFGSAQPQLTVRGISSVLIPLPPTKAEQTAIATALNDADALIYALEKLIDKKRNIKQGTMQELLKPKEDWEVKKLGEIFRFLNTANNSRAELVESGEVEYIHYGDIHTRWDCFLDCSKNELPFIDKAKVNSVPFLENGDLVIADASEDYEGLATCVEIKNIGKRKIVAGLHTLLLRGDKNIIADGFKGYLRSYHGVKDTLIRLSTGVSVFGISKTNLKEVEVSIPPTVEEQIRIVQILSDMDAEIEAMEKKLEKYKMIKQGMMQNLLTGKIRLV